MSTRNNRSSAAAYFPGSPTYSILIRLPLLHRFAFLHQRTVVLEPQRRTAPVGRAGAAAAAVGSIMSINKGREAHVGQANHPGVYVNDNEARTGPLCGQWGAHCE